MVEIESDADYLRDLANRLMHVPVMYGTDQSDVDRLLEIAGNMQAVCNLEDEPLTVKEINDAGFYAERYGDGFLLADYSKGDDARYCGVSKLWRKQPIVHDPFPTEEAAYEVGRDLAKGDADGSID